MTGLEPDSFLGWDWDTPALLLEELGVGADPGGEQVGPTELREEAAHGRRGP